MTREVTIQAMINAYRRWKRLRASLCKPPLNRQFKNPKCKSAKKLAERREDVERRICDTYNEMLNFWHRLPEVRQVCDLRYEQQMLAWLAKLTKPNRNPRYLKSQMSLDAQPEEAKYRRQGAGSKVGL